MSTNIILGAFENVSFPEFSISGIRAKIDTGAFTGALHCTKIAEEDGGKVLRFSPFDQPELEITKEDFVVRHVRSSNGKREKRYFITTEIVIAGETYPIILSLANRSEMKVPVLIGRRFLRKNQFLVDVTKRRRV